MESSSMPTRDTLAQTSITMPLSRIRSTTSAKLEESVDFCTFAIVTSSFPWYFTHNYFPHQARRAPARSELNSLLILPTLFLMPDTKASRPFLAFFAIAEIGRAHV